MCGSKPEEDSDGAQGPLKKRSCTDVFCLLFFLAFLAGMGYVAFLGFSNGGDPYKLIFGVDSWGNTCNRDNDPIENATYSGQNLTGLTNIYYFQWMALVQPMLFTSARLCVSACPNDNISTITDLQEYSRETGNRLCRYDIEIDDYRNDSTAEYCPTLPIVEHTSILNRCFPKLAAAAGQSLLSTVTDALSHLESQCEEAGGDFFSHALQDLQRTWKQICYLCGIAAVTALLITLLMRFFAAIVIWTLVLGAALGSLAGTGYCWYTWHAFNKTPTEERSDTDAKRVKNWKIYACVATGTTAIILLILLVMRKRIGLVVQLFREASKAAAKMPGILLQPLWTLIVLASGLAAIMFIFMYVQTAGDPVVDTSTGLVEFKQGDLLFYMKWYYLFGVLWYAQFVFACHQMTIAGAVAAWYFTINKKELRCPVLGSIGRLIRYHLGSVAFGSFIVALIQFARIILAYVTRKLRGKTGPVIDFVLKCIACCLWCFEKVIKYINRNAYIMVAIYGYSFCKGAQRAFTLLVSNALRVGAINSVGAFVLLLGKLAVTAIVVIIGLEIFKNDEDLCFIWVPLVVVGIASALVAHTFLSVYGMAIDTIFLCFCEDCERNDGITKPYFMSKGLMEYVANASAAMDALKARKTTAATTEAHEVAEVGGPGRMPPPPAKGAGANANVEW